MVAGHPPGITAVIILGMIPGMIPGIMAIMAAIGDGIHPITTRHGITPGVITMVTGVDGTDLATSIIHMLVPDGAVRESLTTSFPAHTIVAREIPAVMVIVSIPIIIVPTALAIAHTLLPSTVVPLAEEVVADPLVEVAVDALPAVVTLMEEGDNLKFNV
jgi:hypothetical protein